MRVEDKKGLYKYMSQQRIRCKYVSINIEDKNTNNNGNKNNNDNFGQGDNAHGDSNHDVFSNLPFMERQYYIYIEWDCSVHGKALIWVCLPKEPYDEDILEDTNVGFVIIFEDNNNLQMTTMYWNLTHARLDEVHILLRHSIGLFSNKEPEVSVDCFDRFPQECLQIPCELEFGTEEWFLIFKV